MVQIVYFCFMIATAEVIHKMNRWGSEQRAFLFVFDYLCQNVHAWPLEDINPEELRFEINGITNSKSTCTSLPQSIVFESQPISFDAYEKAYKLVMYHLRRGDSYLLNLTQAVQLKTNLNLLQLFDHSSAPYKLWMRDQFTVFSPEPFIRIIDGAIHTYPMKGTIDADIPDAEQLLLNNKKELAEHYTIVDLLRNDLGMVADKVQVKRFRYPEMIKTTRGKLLQTSSHITGRLNKSYQNHLGNILFKLLPAGSISGAPKRKTCEIIAKAEGYERAYYTGVFGIFDGQNLDSAVMIRFVEQTPNGLIFKAGGGITVNSQIEDEYEELMQKVYLPLKTDVKQ